MSSLMKKIDGKIVWIIVILAFLLGMVIFGIRFSALLDQKKKLILESNQSFERQNRILLSEELPGLEDYYIPTSKDESMAAYPLRTPQDQWSKEEINQYWIDPKEEELGNLKEKNDQTIKNSLRQ